MGILSDIFAHLVNDGLPVMSIAAMNTVPAGLAVMLDSTDMIASPTDLLAAAPTVSVSELIDLSPSEYQTAKLLELLASSLQTGVAAAHMFSNADGRRDVCIVSNSSEIWADSMTGREMENVPGILLDWYGLIQLHENAHCKDFKDGGLPFSSLQAEIYADTTAFKDYYTAYRNGVFTDPEIPYALRAQRAIYVMENGHMHPFPEKHSVNAIVPLPGEGYAGALHQTNFSAGEAMLAARQSIIDEIGGDVYQFGDRERLSVIERMMRRGLQVDGLKHEEVLDAVKAKTFDEAAGAALVAKAEARMPQDAREQYDFYIREKVPAYRRDAAEMAVAVQPPLLYEASKRMLESGAFEGNPAGRQFVANYVDGVERYDPARHGVAPEDRPVGRPAIVERLAEQFAPAREITPGFGFPR